MYSEKTLISIITVSYNAVTSIEETIQSVINQTYSNIEYIIIDGGSSDGTVDIIKKYEDRISFWVSEPDKGIYDAMNKGGMKASGKYIQFLNAGDVLYSTNIYSEIIKKIKGIDADIFYGDMILKRNFGLFYMIPLDLSVFETEFPIYHPTTLMSRKLFQKNLFNERYKIASDFDLFRKLFYKNASFHYIPIPITIFEGEEGISSTRLYEGWMECQSIIGRDEQKLWLYKKTKFYIVDKIRYLTKKIIGCIFPEYFFKLSYRKLLKNTRIKKQIQNAF